MSTLSKLFRALSIAMGLGMVTVSTSVVLAHIVEPDQRQLVVAMAAGSAFAAFAMALLWRRHRLLAVMALVGVLLGEAFAYAQSVERILSVREERSRLVATDNQPHAILAERVRRLVAEVAAKDEAVIAEASKGGCRGACNDKKKLADEARARLTAAENELALLPVPKTEAKLAAKLGVPEDFVDILLAGMVSAAMLIFQLVFLSAAHAHEDDAPARAEAETVQADTPRTKHEAAAEFARAYAKKHGRPPAWAEVQKAGFSAATASRALKLVR